MTDDGGISPVPRAARPYQGHSAGIVSRLSAAVVDALVVGAILLAAYVAVAGLRLMLDPRSLTLPRAGVAFNVTAAFGVAVLYLTLAWTVAGRSYGDLVMGLRVVGRRGRALGPLGALVRALACVVFPVGLLWCAVSPRNRSVQDLLLGSSVVYDWRAHAARIRRPA